MKNIFESFKNIKYTFYDIADILTYEPINFFIKLSNFFNKSKKQNNKKRIGIVFLLGLGDYIVFRNFLPYLKQKFSSYEIVFIGATRIKELYELLDKNFADKTIWIDLHKADYIWRDLQRLKFKNFKEKYLYRLKILKEISHYKFDYLLIPTDRKAFYFEDNIARLANANEKITLESKCAREKKWQMKIASFFYTKQIPLPPNLKYSFDFYKYKWFFEQIIGRKIALNRPFINPPTEEEIEKVLKKLSINKPYVVFAIGSSSSYRRWHPRNFAKVAKFLKERYGFSIVVTGSKGEIPLVEEFEKEFNGVFYNLVGRTSLKELMAVIYESELLVSNDTSAVHFAIAMDNTKPCFVIYSGKFFGDTIPYPKEIAPNYHLIAHPYIEKNYERYKILSNIFTFRSVPNINEIKFESVVKIITGYLRR
jgi:ADP-heptose:LPS heptosyltransferase